MSVKPERVPPAHPPPLMDRVINSSHENQYAKSVDVSCMGGWESESTVAEGTVSFAFPPTSPSHRARA